MNEQKEIAEKYSIEFDDNSNPRMLVVKIPIASIAEDVNGHRTIYLLGFLEDLKTRALIFISDMMQKNKSKIITGVSGVNASNKFELIK